MSWKIESPHDQMLHLATLKGDVGKLRTLLDSGRVYVDVRDSDGTTPLMLSVANNYTSCVVELLEQGADPNSRRTSSGATALHYAAQNGFLDLVKLLMTHKAEVDLPCHSGSTPLMAAVQNNQLPIVEYLHQHGANIHNRMMDGTTAIFLAAQEGHYDILKYLIKHGAEINTHREADGVDPIWISSQMGHTEIVAQLIFSGAKVDKARKDGMTPLAIACLKGHFGVCELLLRSQPNMGLLVNGYTPLHLAIVRGQKDIIKLMLHRGADPEAQDARGFDAVTFALKRGRDDLAQIIQSWQADQQTQMKRDSLSSSDFGVGSERNVSTDESDRPTSRTFDGYEYI